MRWQDYFLKLLWGRGCQFSFAQDKAVLLICYSSISLNLYGHCYIKYYCYSGTYSESSRTSNIEQNPLKHLRCRLFQKNIFLQNSWMVYWIWSTPRLLDTSLLYVDTTVSQIVYAHRPCPIVFFCLKRKKTFFFKNCLVFFVPRLTIFILFSNSLQ